MVKHKLLFGFIFLFVCILLGCEDKERIYISEKMDHVELLLDNDRLDSAYNVLGNISSMIEEMGESEIMRYDLLRISCMNKMFVPLNVEEKTMKQVVGYYEEHGDADEKMESCLLMGSVYRDMGDAPMALEWFGKAVEHGNKGAKNKTLLAKIHGQKADLFYNQRLYDDALRELDAMKILAEEIQDRELYINAFSFSSSVLYAKEDYDSALVVGKKMFDVFVGELKDTIEAAQSLGTSISIYADKGNHEIAESLMVFYEKHSGLFDSAGNIAYGKECYYDDKASIYMLRCMYDSAEHYYRKLTKAPGLNNRILGYSGLFDIYKIKENKDSMLHYALSFSNNSQKYFDELQTKELERLHTTYNYEQQKVTAEKMSLKAERANLRFWQTLCIAITLAIVFAFVFVIWKNGKKAELEKAKMELQKSKLEAYNIPVEYKNIESMLRDKTKQLEELRMSEKTNLDADHRVADDLQAEVDELDKALENVNRRKANCSIITSLILKSNEKEGSVVTNDEWAELENYVTEMYPSFVENMFRVIPNISKEYIHIVMLLKLDFAPLQIATLLNRSMSTISNARCRMYSKAHGGDKCTTEEADRWIRGL